MPVDFPEVNRQIKEYGKKAKNRQQHLQSIREDGQKWLNQYAGEINFLQEKIKRAIEYNSTLRCAVPLSEPLNAHIPTHQKNSEITILAADGSQIFPDRHSQVEYSLVNVGAIQMRSGAPDPPKETIQSELIYDEQLYTDNGIISEEIVALMRDLAERKVLAELAQKAQPPIITLTDGPLELFREPKESIEFSKRFNDYLEVLRRLYEQNVVTAGYVDKPAADLVTRLLEIAMLPDADLNHAGKDHRPLRGLSDKELFREILQTPGERSAVFAIQSISSARYKDELALHFFYLNVGRIGNPWIVRVEIPAWVALSPLMLDNLHTVLLNQSQIMGNKPYPYVLHRAHEIAIVTHFEKQQGDQMIINELYRQGIIVGQKSNKQSGKDLPGRTRYKA